MDNQDNIAPMGQDQDINPAQVVHGADGAIALKVEQTKLPEFWGIRTKDSITANKFIRRIDNLVKPTIGLKRLLPTIFQWPCKDQQTPGWRARSLWRQLKLTENNSSLSNHSLKPNL
jgi:hypothetical protein